MKKKATPLSVPEIDPLATRLVLNMTQTRFWSRVGITQSGGSRYESGRAIPLPVRYLLAIAYGDKKQRATALEMLTGDKSQ